MTHLTATVYLIDLGAVLQVHLSVLRPGVHTFTGAIDLGQIAIETLNSLNRINREKDRLLEIVEDGEITPDEIADFVSIKKTLDKISLSVDTLQLWIDQTIAEGKLDKTVFEEQ